YAQIGTPPSLMNNSCTVPSWYVSPHLLSTSSSSPSSSFAMPPWMQASAGQPTPLSTTGANPFSSGQPNPFSAGGPDPLSIGQPNALSKGILNPFSVGQSNTVSAGKENPKAAEPMPRTKSVRSGENARTNRSARYHEMVARALQQNRRKTRLNELPLHFPRNAMKDLAVTISINLPAHINGWCVSIQCMAVAQTTTGAANGVVFLLDQVAVTWCNDCAKIGCTTT
ncbi:hypothetical protein KI387_038428, partial [Taxus chinensis]